MVFVPVVGVAVVVVFVSVVYCAVVGGLCVVVFWFLLLCAMCSHSLNVLLRVVICLFV